MAFTYRPAQKSDNAGIAEWIHIASDGGCGILMIKDPLIFLRTNCSVDKHGSVIYEKISQMPVQIPLQWRKNAINAK